MVIAVFHIRKPFAGERPSCFETKDEPAQDKCAYGKKSVTDYPQPDKVVNNPP